MKFYANQHKYYCGIDLHARKMYVCVLNDRGEVKVHKNIKTEPEMLLELIAPFVEDIVIGVECVFCWHPKGTSYGRTGWLTYAKLTKFHLFSAMHCT